MNIQDLPSTFEKIGLSEKESLVYSSLITLGGGFPSKIAEETKLNRTTIYKILLDLSVKGLVNEIKKKNKIYYQVENPNRLLRYVKSQVTIANNNVETVQKLIPDFEGIFSSFTNKPKILYFEKIEGLISLYEDHLTVEKKYEMLAFSNIAKFEDVFPDNFFENYRKTKEKIGITTRGIIPDTERDVTFVNRAYAGYKKEVIPKVKYLPSADFPFQGEIIIYGKKKVSIVNLTKEYLTGIIIEDETIHNMMKMIFELSWNSSKVSE